MKQRRTLSLLLSVVLLLALLAGCGQTPSASDGAISVVDMSGRELSLESPATKVVALTAADCEILYAVGAGDTLIGRGEYCDYPAEVADVSSVQSGAETNIEQIISLKPDLVLMDSMAQTKEQVKQLEDAGITVAVSKAEDIDGVYKAIDIIGALVGKDDEADKLIGSMKSSFEELKSKASGDGSKTVYFEVSPLEYGLWTAGSGSFMNEIAIMLGLKNAFSDVQAWAEISEEQVISRNPDYIVTITMYSGTGPEPVDEIISRSGWENLSAVKNKAILDLPDNELTRPGPRLVDGAKALYNLVYGGE